MEKSILYDLLGTEQLHKWKDKIEETESNTWFFTKAQEAYDELVKSLSENEKEMLETFALAFENKLDYIYYNLKIKILNFGIKIGLELQKAFMEDEDN